MSVLQSEIFLTKERQPTIWGLTPLEIHDRYWASRGVQVVRMGESAEIVPGAELFLLTDSRSLVIFDLVGLIGTLYWVRPAYLCVRIHDCHEPGYRERVITDGKSGFVRFERMYSGTGARLARVALTSSSRLAGAWQAAAGWKEGWDLLRRSAPADQRAVRSVGGSVYDGGLDTEVMAFMRRLVQTWTQPDATIRRAVRGKGGAWTDETADVSSDATIVGSIWVGAGRRVTQGTSAVGPAVMWDAVDQKPGIDALEWDTLEPSDTMDRKVTPARRSSFSRITKRAFDITFALLVLLLTLPFYPFIMLAIWLDDGRPFFFSHARETAGGREFPCLKFRSMRNGADQMKTVLSGRNEADGPQFFMKNDPRLTRVGRFLRKCQLDEMPQFINVLLGQMSIVGPRPSPRQENQFCPEWREARLSLSPGLTGLWQVKRTRRSGMDFQEWIRFDIEYVENVSWWLDLWIIGQTIRQLFKGSSK
jgi:lipopolysaccharide/colanic/teichoic acid biosynthesis glycosyltransferase